MFPINVHSVGKPSMMALAKPATYLREIAIRPLPDRKAVREYPLIDELEEPATVVGALRRCRQNWKAP